MFRPLALLSRTVWTRRRFLAASALAGSGLALPRVGISSAPSLPATLPSVLLSLPRLGTVIECQAFHPSRQHAKQALQSAYDAIDRVDREMSLYRPESDIGRLNRRGIRQAIAVAPSTLKVIQDTLRVAQSSDGALDMTIAPLLRLWGFLGPLHQRPSRAQLARALARVNYQDIDVDPTRHTVRLGHPNMQLDLGSTGKGFAVDRAIEALQHAGIQHGMVNAGGDLRLLGPHPDGNAWLIGVQHPLAPARVLLTLSVPPCSVATSGNYLRYQVYNGRRYGHVIHPKTGYPVETALSATVLSTTAMSADAQATAALILGPKAGLQWLSQQAATEGFIVERLRPGTSRVRLHMTSGMRPRLAWIDESAL